MNDIFLSAPFALLVMAHSDECPALLCVTPCLSGCLLSQITFWHSGLLSQTPRSLRLRASGGSNDKASLTISRQEQGGERGKLNCQREKRREEECRRKGWGGEGALTQSRKMESVIISSFGAHQTLPSLSNTTPLTFLSLSLSTFPICLPASISLTFTHHNIPSFYYSVFNDCTWDTVTWWCTFK